MSGQNDRNSRGLSLTQPIILQWVREKSMGQTKGVHQKCNNGGHETTNGESCVQTVKYSHKTINTEGGL